MSVTKEESVTVAHHRDKKEREALQEEKEPLVVSQDSVSKESDSAAGPSFHLLESCIKLFGNGAKFIIQSLTLGNVIKLLILSLIFPGFLNSDNRASETTKKSVHQPPLLQHFTFEPSGYAKSIVLPAPKSTQAGNAPPNMQRQYDGYFALDKKVLSGILDFQESLRKESVAYQKSTEREIAQMDTGPNTSNAKWSPSDEFADAATFNRILSKLSPSSPKPETTIVLDLNLKSKNLAEKLDFIRKAVGFLIGYYLEFQPNLEVLVRLESNGGTVQSYGLLAEQLRRLREEPGITLTIACDLNALSGGYMVASVASPGHLIASPFASVGSIGVLSPAVLDFQEALNNHGIKEDQVKSGDHKPSGGLFSGVSESELQQIQDRNDRIHAHFKDYVLEQRSDRIAQDHDYIFSGDYWLGRDAKNLGLIDETKTSDAYLDEKARNGIIVLNLKSYDKKKIVEDKGLFLTCLDLITSFLGWIAPLDDNGSEQARVAAERDALASAAGILGVLRDYVLSSAH